MRELGLGLAQDRRDDRSSTKKLNLHRSSSGGQKIGAKAPIPDPAADRRSFGPDPDAVFSHLSSSNLAGRERGGPDPEKSSPPHRETLTSLHDNDLPSRSKECQSPVFRSEALSLSGGNSRERRFGFLDPSGHESNAAILSPRLFVGGAGGLRKCSAASSHIRSGTFTSPGTPNYRPMGYQKGWNSERVPMPANCSRRYPGSTALLPFNNGRTLPSKWEDAEKWICSPVSGERTGRLSMPPPHYRRPKSKSGPLGAPGGIGGPYSSASPMVPCFESGRAGSLMAGSPFLTGVLVPDRGCCDSNSSTGSGGGGDGGRRSSSANAEPYIVRSASIHGWSDTLIESASSLPCSQDEKLDNIREGAIEISPAVLKKDMATQMSPDESTPSSPDERPFSPRASSAHTIEQLESHFPKMEIRDVQVDDHVTVTRWSKKRIARGCDKRSSNMVEWKKKSMVSKASAWEASETSKCISRYTREEAKITAWENLQKAKAEAAIRKVEMNLEKKRSSSMGKILNKLRSAQKKAQDMRSAKKGNEGREVATSKKRISYFYKTGQISSLSGCFTCHAF